MRKDLLSIKDLDIEDIESIFSMSADLKQRRQKPQDALFAPLQRKTLAMIFQKASTRTRISFEVGMYQLGGRALYLDKNDLQMGRGEPLVDTARILSRYVDAVLVRTYQHKEVEDLAKFAAIPVINGLTDKLHPCQIISDMFTIKEKKGRLKNLKIAYIGDGNNIANSWLYAAAKMNLHLWIACPLGYEPDRGIIKEVMSPEIVEKKQIVICQDPKEAAYQADIMYTDVWASMGQEEEQKKRIRDFAGYQIDEALLQKAREDVLVMHCLPAHRGEEITEAALEGKNSIVFDQAENRLYAQQAILLKLLAEDAL